MQAKPLYFYILLAGVFSAMAPIASDLYLPSLPHIALFYHVPINIIQFSITTFIMGFAFSRLLLATLSDYFGRRKLILLALMVCFIGSMICLKSPTALVFLMGRFVQGFGAGGSNVLARVILRDTVPIKELPKYNSYNSMVAITLMSAAPLAGGYIQHFLNWHVVFVFLSVYSLIACLVAWFVIPETNLHYHQMQLNIKSIAESVKILITNKVYLCFCMVVFMVYGALFAWLASGAVVLQKVVMLSPMQYGWCAALVAMGYFIGSFINSRIVMKVGPPIMMRIGSVCMLIAGLSMFVLCFGFHLVNTAVIVVPSFIALFASSLMFANAYSTALIPYAKIAGIAIAILGTIQLLGGVLTSAIIAWLPDVNQLPLSIIIMISGVLLIMLMVSLKRMMYENNSAH